MRYWWGRGHPEEYTEAIALGEEKFDPDADKKPRAGQILWIRGLTRLQTQVRLGQVVGRGPVLDRNLVSPLSPPHLVHLPPLHHRGNLDPTKVQPVEKNENSPQLEFFDSTAESRPGFGDGAPSPQSHSLSTGSVV
ncbi:hypothetical protein RUM44_006403 [Polyplax serrata]|uniref:Plasma membrane calcium transporting P-type ATPase C-terminal domain-containing protein n=1 Tax=Polyplax serrata TaxID=468196 RepID=A0ABR1AI31_POLSC